MCGWETIEEGDKEISIKRKKGEQKTGERGKKGEIRGVKRTIVLALPSVLAGCKAVVCRSLREAIHNGTLMSTHSLQA